MAREKFFQAINGMGYWKLAKEAEEKFAREPAGARTLAAMHLKQALEETGGREQQVMAGMFLSGLTQRNAIASTSQLIALCKLATAANKRGYSPVSLVAPFFMHLAKGGMGRAGELEDAASALSSVAGKLNHPYSFLYAITEANKKYGIPVKVAGEHAKKLAEQGRQVINAQDIRELHGNSAKIMKVRKWFQLS